MMLPNLKPKRRVQPSKKLKAWHWKIVNTRVVPGTIWMELDDETVKFDIPEFERIFADNVVSRARKKKSASAPKQEAVALLDSKRSYNINIVLGRLRMSNFAIKDAILQMNEQVLDEEKLNSLIKCAPTKEELVAIKSFEGDKERLGDAEKFVATIAEVPNVTFRLELFMFKKKFAESFEKSKNDLEASMEVAKAVPESDNFKRLLETILAFGNYINGSTKRGAQYGFKLEELNKLKGTKSSVDPSMNMLAFLVQHIESHHPKLNGFLEEFTGCKAAARVDQSFLNGEIRKMTQTFRLLEREMSKPVENTLDRFNTVMADFYSTASMQAKDLADRFSELQLASDKMVKFFGENPESTSAQELFVIIDSFIQEYQKMQKYLKQKKEAEEREAKRKEYQEEQKDKKLTERRASELSLPDRVEDKKEDQGAVVDKTTGMLQNSNLNDLTKLIRRKRQKNNAAKRGSIMPKQGTPGDGKKATPKKKKKTPWKKVKDTSTGEVYYYNTETGVSQWEKPSDV